MSVITANMAKEVKKKKLDGRDYYVIPTILITDGVHNGVLYTNQELKKYPEAWNGRPIVINHPSKDGVPCSANDPEIVENKTIGQGFNC